MNPTTNERLESLLYFMEEALKDARLSGSDTATMTWSVDVVERDVELLKKVIRERKE